MSLSPECRTITEEVAGLQGLKGIIMKTKSIRQLVTSKIPLTLLLLVSCSSLIATYNQTAYEHATSLKAESLSLMDRATEPYDNHKDGAEELVLQVKIAYEYAKGIPKNELSTEMWSIIKDPSRNLLGGFLKRWKAKGTLGSAFVTEAKGPVAEAFDQIIELEARKIRQ